MHNKSRSTAVARETDQSPICAAITAQALSSPENGQFGKNKLTFYAVNTTNLAILAFLEKKPYKITAPLKHLAFIRPKFVRAILQIIPQAILQIIPQMILRLGVLYGVLAWRQFQHKTASHRRLPANQL